MFGWGKSKKKKTTLEQRWEAPATGFIGQYREDTQTALEKWREESRQTKVEMYERLMQHQAQMDGMRRGKMEAPVPWQQYDHRWGDRGQDYSRQQREKMERLSLLRDLERQRKFDKENFGDG